LDIDGNGFIEPAEIAQAAARLKLLDRNGDGSLSLEECFPAPGGAGGPPGGAPGGDSGRPPVPPIFTTLDKNGDGRIDAAEMAQAPATLLKLDRNGDGKISIEECLPSAPDGAVDALHGGLVRAERFPADYPAFKGRDLKPLVDSKSPSPAKRERP
jgi:hypothetical protein